MRRAPWGLGIAAVAMSVGWGIAGCSSRPSDTPAVSSTPSPSTASSPTQPLPPGAAYDPEAAKPEFYTSKVRPIFQATCFRCHAGMNRRGGLSMSTHAGMMKGGKDGVVIVPGDPAKSLLVKGIRGEAPAKPMPPKGSRLSATDISTIERWIRAGAVMPADPPVQ